MFWSGIHELKRQEPRYSSIAQSLNIREENFLNHMRYARHQIRAALTHPSKVHLRAIAMFAFTQLQQHSCYLLPP